MRLIPSPTPFPLNIYRNNQITQTTIASAMRKSLDVAPYSFATTLDNFPKESSPMRHPPHKFKHFYPKPFAPTPPNKYIIHHVNDDDDGEEESHEESLLSMLNPFECETEGSDDEDDDNEIYGASSNELFSQRKFLKLLKWKKKKKKKKKKIILFKLLLGILAFFAVKFLLKKAHKFFPAILAFVRRDELYHDGDIELDRDDDFTKTSASDENFAQHRSLFPLTYEVQHKLIL